MVDVTNISSAINAYKNTAGMAPEKSNTGTDVSFSGLLSGSMQNTSSSLRAAETISQKALLNETTLDELAVSISNAEMTLRTVVAVRDRIITAYQDIMKMPV